MNKPATSAYPGAAGETSAAGRTKPSGVQALTLPVFMAAVGICLYRLLFAYPLTPIEQGVDAPLFLADALRMLNGQSIYRDFVHHLTPGTCDLYYALLRLLGVHTWIAPAVLWLAGCIFALAGVFAARYFLTGWTGYIPSLLFLAVCFRVRLDATHNWYAALCAFGAAAILLARRSHRRVIMAGILCGLASWFTQGRGEVAIAALAVFLTWENLAVRRDWRTLIRYLVILGIAFCAAFCLLMAYHFWKAGAAVILQDTYVFVARYARYYRPHDTFDKYWYWDDLMQYTGGRGKALPVIGLRVFVYLLIPLIYVLAAVRLLAIGKNWRKQDSAPVVLFTLAGAFSFLMVARSPGIYRLVYDSLFAFVLLSWYMANDRARGARAAIQAFAVGMAVLLIYFCHSSRVTILNLPAGRVAFRADPEYLETYAWLGTHTDPEDYLYQPDWGTYYFEFELKNPTRVPAVSNSAATPADELLDTLAGLQAHHPRYILWNERLNSPYGDLGADYLGPLRRYRDENYRFQSMFRDGTQLWVLPSPESRSERLRPNVAPGPPSRPLGA